MAIQACRVPREKCKMRGTDNVEIIMVQNVLVRYFQYTY